MAKKVVNKFAEDLGQGSFPNDKIREKVKPPQLEKPKEKIGSKAYDKIKKHFKKNWKKYAIAAAIAGTAYSKGAAARKEREAKPKEPDFLSKTKSKILNVIEQGKEYNKKRMQEKEDKKDKKGKEYEEYENKIREQRAQTATSEGVAGKKRYEEKQKLAEALRQRKEKERQQKEALVKKEINVKRYK